MLDQVLMYMEKLLYIGYLFFVLFVIPTITFIQCPWLHPLRISNDHSWYLFTSGYHSMPRTLKVSVASHACIFGALCYNLLLFVC